MEDGETYVGCEGAVDCDFIFELCGCLRVPRFSDVFVDGFEEAFDLRVLGFVEGGDSRGGGLACEVHRITVCGRMAFASCVGGDTVELSLGFEAST